MPNPRMHLTVPPSRTIAVTLPATTGATARSMAAVRKLAVPLNTALYLAVSAVAASTAEFD